MKDRSKLIVLAALVLLVVSLSTIDVPGLLGIRIGNALPWILGAVAIYLVMRGGCCGTCHTKEEE